MLLNLTGRAPHLDEARLEWDVAQRSVRMSNGRLIEFSTSHGPAAGYLSGPDAAAAKAGAPKAGVIVVQEWWGLVPHIEDIADRFAAAGYLALAPDLYHGKSTVDAEEASHLMHGLDWARAIEEMAAAATYLRTEQHVSRVGIVGFCMGGAAAMLAATTGTIDAYVSYYGFPPQADAVKSIAVPGRLFFGEHESTFSLKDAQAFADAQRHKGLDTELVLYPGAGHAFFNDTRKTVYHAAAAADTWTRTLEFFTQQLS
jgi:carboxymethylenebutenolidase